MSLVLTAKGRETAASFIRGCEEQRKEILDARKDTADDTNLPTVEDIEADLNFSELDEDTGDYYNCWGVTDNYDSESLVLTHNIDFIEAEET